MELLENYQNPGWVEVVEGVDLSELLGIQKWEQPINPQLAGIQRGNFPSFIPKTDQERIQNLKGELEFWVGSNLTWEVTEKLEGSSMTVYMMTTDENPEGYFGVCSRNMDLVKDESNGFWCAAIRDRLEEKIRIGRMNGNCSENIALQGELIGPGIQGNIYGLSDIEFRVFDMYDISKGEYVLPEARREFCDLYAIDHTPVIAYAAVLQNATMGSLIASADGKSQLGTTPMREGVVYKANTVDPSFKVISNAYLMGEKE